VRAVLGRAETAARVGLLATAGRPAGQETAGKLWLALQEQ